MELAFLYLVAPKFFELTQSFAKILSQNRPVTRRCPVYCVISVYRVAI
jgi:hypothetical protein